MAGIVEGKLKDMGLKVPEAASPKVAKILNWKRSGDLLFVSGQVPRVNGEISWIGKVGREFNLKQGQEAARDSALMVLACIKDAVGDLDRVKEIVRIKGYINVDPDFSNVLYVLIMVDLRVTKTKILQCFMGREGVASFQAHHSAARAS